MSPRYRLARRVAACAFGAFVLFGLVATSVRGQERLADVGPRVAEAWGSGELRQLETFFPDEGIHLSLQGVDHRGVSRRQAGAALERFVGGFETEAIAVRRAEALGGSPEQGLVELNWTVRAAGTPEERSFVIFVSLERSSDAWYIREIRVFS